MHLNFERLENPGNEEAWQVVWGGDILLEMKVREEK